MKKLGKHGGRLIVRNLPFSIQEQTLKTWLEKVGVIKEMTVPMGPDNKRNKGFAFVEYEKKNLAEKAIKSLNGKKLQNREISVDYALSKDKYQAQAKAEELSKDFKPATMPQEEPTTIVEESDSETEVEKKDSSPKNKFFEGRVLFIMNLNFLTEEEDLFDRFKDFGKLNYVKIVQNLETGESKGTGFVCFQKPEIAEKVVNIAEESGIELDERRLKVVKAVSKESAVNIKSTKPQNTDKRNLHLTKLALIKPDSKEFQSLTEKEIQMRTLAAKKIKEKLMNPNIFVSPTRLLFKNISKDISEKDLKILVQKILIDTNPDLSSKKLFCQVKVLKETEKLDKKGDPLSKGIAFIEFKKPEYAMQALKLCNNDAKYFGGKFKPIVEFALEDHRVLRIRNLKLTRQKKKNFEKIGNVEKKEKIGRGKRQRMKKRLMKESEGGV